MQKQKEYYIGVGVIYRYNVLTLIGGSYIQYLGIIIMPKIIILGSFTVLLRYLKLCHFSLFDVLSVQDSDIASDTKL